MTARVWALVSIAIILARGAIAQQPNLGESGADLGRFDRPYAPPTPQAAAPSNDFRIDLTLPAYGTNNAIGSAADASGQAGPPDGHITPDLLLRWVHQFSFVRLSVNADAAIDRFFIRSDQNTDSLYGSLKAAFTDGKSDLFVPYAAYAGTLDFGPSFNQWDDTLHSFFLGFTSGVGFDADGRTVAFRDAINTGDWSVSWDFAGGGRLANPSDFANTFAAVSVDIVYNASENLRFGLTPNLRVRNYSNYFGTPRHDLRLGVLARIEWTPDWLTRVNPGAELDFTVSFLRNRSTLQSANYSQWEGGPALLLSWRF